MNDGSSSLTTPADRFPGGASRGADRSSQTWTENRAYPVGFQAKGSRNFAARSTTVTASPGLKILYRVNRAP